MSNSPTPTAEIPFERLPELEGRIAKLNAKAEKLGCQTITVTHGEAFDKEIGDEVFAYVPVFVKGEAPKLNGWTFVATLEHDENGTIIRRIPTFTQEVDLTAYRTATPDNCDHCGYKRRRNDTYIVAYVGFPGEDHIGGYDRPEIGTTKQVGSSCLRDFIGHDNPQQVARFMEHVRDLIEELRGGSFDGGKITPRYSLTEVLDLASHVIGQTGYVSRRAAQETYKTATADAVADLFFQRLRQRNPEPLTVSGDTDKVIEWVRSFTDKQLENDYLYNLYTVCKGDSITGRQFGIAASAITAYQREQRKEIERKASNRVDEFLGEKGDRVEVEFKVTQVFTYDSDYGPQHKHILLTTTGHTLVWKTGTWELEQGKSYTANFSVKGQDTHADYGKQTLVFRPRTPGPQEVS